MDAEKTELHRRQIVKVVRNSQGGEIIVKTGDNKIKSLENT
jgi:hypothetical protein